MSTQNDQHTSGSTEIKLWINNDWYIPVDNEGYCIGESAEGALGFVVKLSRSGRTDFFTALKIPRLMGDTHRENAYICELMDQELKAVEFVENYRTPVPKLNLLGVAHATSLLRGEIRTIPGDSGGVPWNRSIVLVRYKKGEQPRFCLVKHEGETLKFWPTGIDPITLDQYRELEKRSFGWSQTVFIENNNDMNQASLFVTSDALTRNSIGETWYAGLPSVNYSWAPGTLQESISLLREPENGIIQSLRGQWTIKQHLELAEQICRGLYSLHARKMLHADLRPANIVFQAEPENPTSYLISDYGSFAQTAPTVLQRANDGVGQTMGPVTVGERASAFYAPERRIGREREASDTAVILPVQGEKTCLKIVLGWRSDLIDEQGQPRMDRIRTYIEDAKQPNIELPDKILQAGDRVQLRESIFELIEDEQRIGDKQVLTCAYNYWQIYHGRVAVRPIEDLQSITWFPIPRTIELMKWSVATDLYSLGALLLYSIFRNKVDSKDNGSEIEDQFREMLAYLNSEPYFNAVWPELDWLRFCMEEALKTTRGADDFRSLPFTRYDRHINDRRDAREPNNLLAAAEELTNRLAQTAPGVSRIVDGLEYNLAAFVFIMHFALCCLHRESHFTETPEEKRKKAEHPEWKQMLPFCKHRRETPEELIELSTIATKRALDRLSNLEVVIERGELKAMEPEDRSKIGSFDPRPDVSIRIERDQFKRRIDELEPELSQEKKKLILLQEAFSSREAERKELAAKVTELTATVGARDLWSQEELDKREKLLRGLRTIVNKMQQQLGERGLFERGKLARLRESVTEMSGIVPEQIQADPVVALHQTSGEKQSDLS